MIYTASMLRKHGVGKTALHRSKVFNALQFHIHTGAEHTINGVRHDIEFHFVPYVWRFKIERGGKKIKDCYSGARGAFFFRTEFLDFLEYSSIHVSQNPNFYRWIDVC